MTPRALFGLLFHADKALDLVQASLDMGVLARLDAGETTLSELCAATGAVPLRMYKLLDGLESLGLVDRRQDDDEIENARYRGRHGGLEAAARAVLGPASIDRDRNGYAWRAIHGRIPDVVRGAHADQRFDWPPKTPEQVAGFEASMAAGCPPIVESFRAVSRELFPLGRPLRWLDVGGGDGTLAAEILRVAPHVAADVYNLEATRPLVARRAEDPALEGRLGFVGGDFLEEALPRGYDVVSLVRVLHDWPADVARRLLTAATEALAPGARIVVCEEFRDADRLAVQFFWTYFLIGVDSCTSRLREVEWYTQALGRLGYRDIRVLPGGFDVVVATRA